MKNVNSIELTPKQQAAVDMAVSRYVAQQPYTCIAGPAGTGKAQPNTTILPTPNGFKQLGELRENDFVFDRLGIPTRIIGVFPRGKKQVYEVIFEDGVSTLCADDHLWTCILKGNEKGLYPTSYLYKQMKKGVKFDIPMNEEVEYCAKPKSRYSPFDAGVQSQRTHNNFIKDYIDGSYHQRWSAIQGIIEANGWNKSYFNSPNLDLIKDIRSILNSLGFIAPIVKTRKGYSIKVNILNLPNKKTRRIVKIRKLDKYEEMTCILVDNPEHLYLTNDYIVTHNTTIVEHIIKQLKLEPNEVAYCAYTGRAAEVLRKKGNPNVVTAHALLYWYTMKVNGEQEFKLKLKDSPYKVIVVDEISMIPKDMWNDLKYSGSHIIALGDNFQLPPIDKKADNHILDSPHATLTEIMRQEEGSDIIEQSVKLREGKKLEPYEGKDIKVIPFSELTADIYSWSDQIICATNKTKDEINSYFKKGETELKIGDKVICTKNSWDILSENSKTPLVNGTIGYVTKISEGEAVFQYTAKMSEDGVLPPFCIEKKKKRKKRYLCEEKAKTYTIDIETTEGEVYKDIVIDKKALWGGGSSFSYLVHYYFGKKSEKEPDRPRVPITFEYAYAITVHKAQGSQWDKVTVIEENFPFEKTEHARHLYTAITRAAKQCVVVLND